MKLIYHAILINEFNKLYFIVEGYIERKPDEERTITDNPGLKRHPPPLQKKKKKTLVYIIVSGFAF